MMKAFMKMTFVALVVCAFVSISAYAGDKVEKKTVTFPQDIMVNGTLVKAGDYEIKFDGSTGELAIVKDGKIKAKTSAHFETRNEKAKNTSVRTVDKGSNAAELIGFTFGGSRQDLVVGTSSGTVTGNN